MDQVLNMNAIVAAGAGKLLVGNRTLPGDVREAARRILEDARCRAAAREVREVFARYPAADRFAGFLTELLG
jgi:UDP:flavonoid glycosyltransferase YjiC (YdhE family)